MKMGEFCPVCGRLHPYIADCGKYGTSICGAHCESCEYKLGELPFSGIKCGHRSTTQAVKLPIYAFLTDEKEVMAEINRLQGMTTEQISVICTKTKMLYQTEENADSKKKCRTLIAACMTLMRDRADDVIAQDHIPTMEREQIMEYRRELCGYIAENKYNPKLKRAINTALDICNSVLSKTAAG